MTAALMQKSGGMGLMGAAQLKKLAGKASLSAGNDRQIDEKLWKENVVDLPQVMAVAQNIYLALEHNNEALVRVAVEIVTCRQARKCLWWDSMWYGDDYKREHFKEIVAEKFKIALANAGGNCTKLSDVPDKKDVGDPKAFAELQQRLKDAEAAAKAAQQQQKLAEMKCRELDEGSGDAQARMKELEKSLEAMRAAAREKTQDSGNNTSAADAEKLAEMEKRLKAAEQEKAMMSQKLADVETKMKAAIEEHKAALAVAQSAQVAAPVAETKKEGLSPNSAAAAQRNNAPAGAGAAKTIDPNPEMVAKMESMKDQMKEFSTKLSAERKRTAETETERDQALEEAERLRKELEMANERAARAEQNPSQALAEAERLRKELEMANERAARAEQNPKETASHDNSPSNRDDAGPAPKGGMTKEQREEMAELRKKAEMMDKMSEKLKLRNEELSGLKTEKEAWEVERMKMLRMLHAVKEQLKKVTEIAEKKGCGKLLQECFDESGVTASMNDPEYTCFSRLYDDALRRQKKQKDITESKFSHGTNSLPVATLGSQFLRRGSVTQGLEAAPPPAMNATWGGANPMTALGASSPYDGRRGSTGSPGAPVHNAYLHQQQQQQQHQQYMQQQQQQQYMQHQGYNQQGLDPPGYVYSNSRPNSRMESHHQHDGGADGEPRFVSTGHLRMDVPNVSGFNGSDTLSSTVTRRGLGSTVDPYTIMGDVPQMPPSMMVNSWHPQMSVAPFESSSGMREGSAGHRRALSPPRTAQARQGLSATSSGIPGADRRSPSPIGGHGLPAPVRDMERSGRLRPLLLGHSQSEPMANFRGLDPLSPIKSSAGSSPLTVSGSPGGADILAASLNKSAFLAGVAGPVTQHGRMRGHLLVVRPNTQTRDREQRSGVDPFFGSKALHGHSFGNSSKNFGASPTALPSPLFEGDGHPDFSPSGQGERILVTDQPKARKLSNCEGLENILTDTLDA